MNDALPLTFRAPGDVVFRRCAEPVTAAGFLGHVADTAAALPDRTHALNFCRDRYAFLVAFAAVLVRGQVSLLTSDRTPHRLGELLARYPGAYALCDKAGEDTGGADRVVLPPFLPGAGG